MKTELQDMSLKELWELFPIFLVEHNSRWVQDYAQEEAILQRALATCSVARISHIGSTAIPGIWAKNIVDILLEIEDGEDIRRAAEITEGNGFHRMSETARRISLCRGYTPNGFSQQVYHLHIRYRGDNGELYFRDYLKEHRIVAEEYEKMKLELWKRNEHNRDAYTEGKTAFVEKWTAEARREYPDRYL